MELKPEKNNVEPKYPNEDGIKNDELNKPLKKWKKVGITAAVLGSLGIMGAVYFVNEYAPVIEATPGVALEPDRDIAMFNSKFEAYEGNRIKGSQVKQLITKVIVNNNEYNNEADRSVTINKKETAELSQYKTSILAGKLYKVEIEYGVEGFVKNINITEIETAPVVNEVKEENKISFKKITKEDFIKKIEGIIKWANHNGLA